MTFFCFLVILYPIFDVRLSENGKISYTLRCLYESIAVKTTQASFLSCFYQTKNNFYQLSNSMEAWRIISWQKKA